MIERYTIHSGRNQLIDRFKIADPEEYKPRYNAAPSQLLPVISHDSPGGFSYFYWGSAPEWAKNKSFAERIINTRAELISSKPVLLRSLKRNRCLIPADGFYLWKKWGKKTSIPWFVRFKSKEIFSFAGIWEDFDDHEGNTFHTFSIVTMPSYGWLADINERVPTILRKQEEQIWMSNNSSEGELLALFNPIPADLLEGYNISPLINSLKNDGPGLILPSPPADQFGNLTLFS
jgi:putative SOS response-associated peptidase YedK